MRIGSQDGLSAVKIFITAFCTGAVLLGILYILVPKGQSGKAVRYAFCLCFLGLVLSAAVKISGGDFKGFSQKTQDFGNEKLSAAAARTVFAEALTDAGVNYKKITVFTDKTESGGINITKVYVYTSASAEEVNAVVGSDNYEVVVMNE